jgi:DNA mismatch repair protein MSH2
MADAPVVMAVALGCVDGVRTVGVAFADASARSLGACEFADDEHFCSLETVLVQLGAKECVLPKVSARGLSVCLAVHV